MDEDELRAIAICGSAGARAAVVGGFIREDGEESRDRVGILRAAIRELRAAIREANGRRQDK